MEELAQQMLFAAGRRVPDAEQRSWHGSLPVPIKDLTDAGLGGVEVLVEYRLPLTSMRIDAVLAGRHPRTGQPSFVVVELKQWSSAHRFEDNDHLVSVPGTGGTRLHPLDQVQSYCDYLGDFLRALEHQPDALAGVAYLHNANDPAAVADLRERRPTNTASLFTGAERGKFLDFLRTRLSGDQPGVEAADLLTGSAVAPSRQLLKVAADEVRDRERFILLSEQKLAFEMVRHEVSKARAADDKRVVVVTGGPGSGKSVIALSLLGDLARSGRSVMHATGSKSFTQTLRRVVGHRAPRVKGMFGYFNSFMSAEPNGLDVLILDEAHRIRETSANRFTRVALRTGRSQLDELIGAARVPVFLLDSNQVVRPGELGSRQQIEERVAELGLRADVVELDGQFRCGGSTEYVAWIERVLGLRPGRPEPWPGDPAFEVDVADSPVVLETMLRARMAEGDSARMAAGYCWPWSDPRPDGSLVPDVTVGEWQRPWNVKGERAVGSAPPWPLWATEEGGFDQVGCVYTAQGFEYDWAGVIIGADLVWRDGRLVTDRGANRDPVFRSRKTVSDGDFDRLVRNLYKVLLTRGMKGVVLHAVDGQTQAALRELLPRRRVATD